MAEIQLEYSSYYTIYVQKRIEAVFALFSCTNRKKTSLSTDQVKRTAHKRKTKPIRTVFASALASSTDTNKQRRLHCQKATQERELEANCWETQRLIEMSVWTEVLTVHERNNRRFSKLGWPELIEGLAPISKHRQRIVENSGSFWMKVTQYILVMRKVASASFFFWNNQSPSSNLTGTMN